MAAKPVTTWYTICVPLIGPSFGKIRLDGTSTGTVKGIFGTHGPTTGTVRSTTGTVGITTGTVF